MSAASVLLVCQFGQPVRGLSPYCSPLLEALHAIQDLQVYPVDYRAAYPGFLHPAAKKDMSKSVGELHWGRPWSWRRVANMDADIIHIQHWSAPMACYLAPLAGMARRKGKRVVVTMHNPGAHEVLDWTRPCEQKLVNLSDTLVVHNARGAAILTSRFDVDAERIHTIPHGACVESSPATIEAGDHALLGLDPARRYVCVFGNLRGYKGVDVLLSAWSHVVEKLADVDLVIAGRLWTGHSGFGARIVAKMLGTDHDAERLHTALAQPGLAERVHMLEGFQSDVKIDALIRLSEFAVFPYVRFSSQSGAACRAAAQGCPVLVTDVGGLPDLAIDPSWIVTPGDDNALASIMIEKLSRPNGLQADREAQLQCIRANSWAEVASAHSALYDELI